MWREVLESMAQIWTNLDFKSAKRQCTLGAIRKYVKWSQGLVSRVTLPCISTSAEGIPRFITTRCKHLQELTIAGDFIGGSLTQAIPSALHLKTLVVGAQCQVTIDCVSQLLANCKSLERAEFYSVQRPIQRPAVWEADLPNLVSLTLNPTKRLYTSSAATQAGLLSVNSLVNRIPNIKNLDLSGPWQMWELIGQYRARPDFSSLVQLQALNIKDFQARERPLLPGSLQSLDMSKTDFQVAGLQDGQFPHLVRLSLAKLFMLQYMNLKPILDANKGNLTHLDLSDGYCSADDIKELARLGYLDGVQDLRISGLKVQDDIVNYLVDYARNLNMVHLSRTKVTGVGVKILVTYLKKTLTYVCLNHCTSVSADAAEWARSRGITVDFTFKDDVKPGRKLRW